MTATEMTFTVDSKPFAAACTVAGRRIPTKPEPPILGGARLEVADGRLTVAAFDYTVSSASTVEVTGAQDGRCLVSGRLLAELARSLPAKPVTAAPGPKGLNLTCGTVRLSLPTLPVEDYPTLPTLPDPAGTVDAQSFAEAVERVAPAADLGGAAGLPALTGVHLTLGPGGIDLLATNRYRGAALTIGWAPGGPNTDIAALVPAAVLIDFAKLVDAPGEITITYGEGVVGLSLPHATVICRQLDARQFPASLPKQLPGKSDTPVTVAVGPLTAAVKRAAMVLEPTAPVRLDFSTGEVSVGGTGEGDVAETLPCDAAGPGALGIKAVYLLDALGMTHAEKVEFTLPARKRQALILTVPGDASYRHFVMPIV